MAINWDKEYGTSEPKKSKINWEKEYNPTGFKERIDTEKADLRSKGLPVSVRDDRSAPTMGGSILRDILKVPATLLARPGQALGAIQGLTPEEQTVKSKYLGDIKTVQTGKDVLSDVGRGLELASYGVGIGAGKNILAQSGKQAAKQIAKRTAIEGAVGGFSGSAGRVITNQSGNLKQDLKDIALGTGIGTIAGGALGYAGGRLGGKVLSAEERAMERAVGKGGKFNIPGVTTPKVTETPKIENLIEPKIQEARKYKSANEFIKNTNWKQKSEIVNNYGNDYEYHLSTEPNLETGKTFAEQKTKGEIGMRGQSMGEGVYSTKNPQYWESQLAYEQNGETPTHLYLVKIKNGSKSGMLESGNEAQTLNKPNEITVIKKVLTNNEDRPLDIGLAESMRDEQILNDFWNSSKVVDNSNNLVDNTQKPFIQTPEFKSKITEGETVLDNYYNNPDASPGSHKLYSEIVYNDIANDPERVKRIAMGSNEPTTNGVPADAYYAIAKNEAVKSGDINAIKELANSDVGTISGKKLEANKLTQEGDIVDTLRDIKKARAKAVGVSEEVIKKQETTLVGKLKTTIKGLSDDIINDLICK